MSLLDLYTTLWHPAACVLSDVVAKGILLDPEVCAADSERLRALQEPHLVAANDWAGCDVNWGSPKQVAAFLYDECKFPIPPVQGTLKAVKLVRPGERPTSEAALLHVADNTEDPNNRFGLRSVLAYRKLSKEAQFARDLPGHVCADGRIHPGLASTTATARLSCKLPNAQQIPASGDMLRAALGLPDPQIRRAFVAKPGHALVVLDFSALEWRVLAHFLAQLFDDWSIVQETSDGVDPHTKTAEGMGCTRPVGKTLNYSTLYCKSAAGLGAQLRDDNGDSIGRKAAQQYLDKFFLARPGIQRFQEYQVNHWKSHGHVTTLLNRKRWIDTEWKGNFRKAANTPIQGSAHDIMTAALVSAAKYYTPVLQIHDELIFEVPNGEAETAKQLLTAAMQDAIQEHTTFHCPLAVSGGVGDNWDEAK